MKKLSLFILGTVILASCGQEVAPTSVPPVKTEAPAPVSEIPNAPVVETQVVPVSTESGNISSVENNHGSVAQMSTWITQENTGSGNMNAQNILTKEAAVNLIKWFDNENPIFSEENKIVWDFTGILATNKEDLITMFKLLWAPELINLPEFWWNQELNDSICKKIAAKNKVVQEDLSDCQYQKVISLLRPDNTHFFFSIDAGGWFGPRGLIYLVYDISAKKIYSATKPIDGSIYVNNDQLYAFDMLGMIQWNFDLKNNKWNSWEFSLNKSRKWIVNDSGDMLKIKSFPDKESDYELDGYKNLSEKAHVLGNKGLSFGYFEASKESGFFAMLTKTEEPTDSTSGTPGNATLLYGKLEKDWLTKAKTIDILYNSHATFCGDSGNTAFFIKEKYLVTVPGCPVVLESTIFDMEKWEFLYRSGDLSSENSFLDKK